MKNALLTTALLGLLTTGQAMAHQDHSHGSISENAVLKLAQKSIKKMTFKDMGFDTGKLDASWKTIKDANFKIVKDHPDYYVVSVKNIKSDKTLYMKINKSGRLLKVTQRMEGA